MEEMKFKGIAKKEGKKNEWNQKLQEIVNKFKGGSRLSSCEKIRNFTCVA